MKPTISRTIAVLVIVGCVGAVAWVSATSDDEPTVAEVRAERDGDERDQAAPEPIPVLGEADTLTGLDGWLNTDATSLEEIRAENELTVVQFWTFGCVNCKNTLAALRDIHAEFGDRIEIVGVHAPEFAYEADVDNIVGAAEELGVTWPIALDTDKRNFHRWQEGPTAWWPTVYLIDGEGRLRMQQRGDGTHHYVRLADYIERLLDGEA